QRDRDQRGDDRAEDVREGTEPLMHRIPALRGEKSEPEPGDRLARLPGEVDAQSDYDEQHQRGGRGHDGAEEPLAVGAAPTGEAATPLRTLSHRARLSQPRLLREHRLAARHDLLELRLV